MNPFCHRLHPVHLWCRDLGRSPACTLDYVCERDKLGLIKRLLEILTLFQYRHRCRILSCRKGAYRAASCPTYYCRIGSKRSLFLFHSLIKYFFIKQLTKIELKSSLKWKTKAEGGQPSRLRKTCRWSGGGPPSQTSTVWRINYWELVVDLWSASTLHARSSRSRKVGATQRKATENVR